VSVSVLGEMSSSDDSTVSCSRHVRIGIGREFPEIGIDELSEDSDSSFERNDERNWERSRQEVSLMIGSAMERTGTHCCSRHPIED